jgi:rhodanese-related sulfurtransferase
VNFFLENYNWVWALAALASGTMLGLPALRKAQGGELTPTQAVMLINREKGVLIDISNAEEFAQAHAAGALNVPLAQLETSTALPKKKTVPLIVLCPTGSRAVRAVTTLKKLGFESCRALSGGTQAWRQAGLPIDKFEKQPA